MIQVSGPIQTLINKHVKEIVQAPILNSRGLEMGWNTKFISENGSVFGGGINPSKETSFKIALAETIELFEKEYLLSDDEKRKLKFDSVPTRCGLAVGFQREATEMRSLAEGVERWIWSQWVDKRCAVEVLSEQPFSLSMLATYHCEIFEKVYYFKKSLIFNLNGKLTMIEFGATIGIKNGGAFPGSRVGFMNDDLWTHALIESYRHFHIFSNLKDRKDQQANIIDRINYFGTHADSALQQILKNPTSKEWPTPVLDFKTEIRDGENGYFMFRSLFKDYKPWHEGGIDRFIF